jgi:hypothetical protein
MNTEWAYDNYNPGSEQYKWLVKNFLNSGK